MMFNITNGVGFQITFDNGYTVSIQFGPDHYCDNYSNIKYRTPTQKTPSCKDAELAIIDPDGDLVTQSILGSEDNVITNCTPKQALKYMNIVAEI